MHSTALRTLTLASSLCIAVSAFASTRRADLSEGLYIDLANQPAYSSVGQVLTNSGLGSGTLISSQWMLTAAHVLSNSSTGKRFAIGGTTYTIDNVIRFSDSYSLGVDDFALCRLSTPVTDIAPALLWNGGGEVGKLSTSVGYGGTGTGFTGNTGALGRRAFQNVIDGYNVGNLKGLVTDFDSPTSNTSSLGSSTPTDLEGCAVPGDSGGSLWANFGGVDYVVGVTSYVWWPGGTRSTYGYYGDGSGYSRVGDVSDWIFRNTGVQAVPEPATFAALGLGVAALLRRRRRA